MVEPLPDLKTDHEQALKTLMALLRKSLDALLPFAETGVIECVEAPTTQGHHTTMLQVQRPGLVTPSRTDYRLHFGNARSTYKQIIEGLKVASEGDGDE